MQLTSVRACSPLPLPAPISAPRFCQGSAYAQGCTQMLLSAPLSAGFCVINLLAGFNAVPDPACAAARSRAAAHSGDIVRPSCASDSVREHVEHCHSLRPSASWLRCGTCSLHYCTYWSLVRSVCCCQNTLASSFEFIMTTSARLAFRSGLRYGASRCNVVTNSSIELLETLPSELGRWMRQRLLASRPRLQMHLITHTSNISFSRTACIAPN
jgi:hypothetical protein